MPIVGQVLRLNTVVSHARRQRDTISQKTDASHHDLENSLNPRAHATLLFCHTKENSFDSLPSNAVQPFEPNMGINATPSFFGTTQDLI